MSRVVVHKADTGMDITVDGRVVASFTWITGMSEDRLEVLVDSVANRLREFFGEQETGSR